MGFDRTRRRHDGDRRGIEADRRSPGGTARGACTGRGARLDLSRNCGCSELRGGRTHRLGRAHLARRGRQALDARTLLDGKVESFVALREDAPYGENLTAVWYRKIAAADGTGSWQTKAFDDQDQSKAIRAVKQALALADSTDASWPVAVAAVAAAEPEPMAKGLLESDALAPLVAELEDPQPIVEMLEDAGWQAAWIGPLEGVALATAGPDAVACTQEAEERTSRSVRYSAGSRAL